MVRCTYNETVWHPPNFFNRCIMKKTILLTILILLLSIIPVSADDFTNHINTTEDTLILLIVVDVVLITYVFLNDNTNDTYYTGIIISVLSVVLSFVIATMLIGGVVSSVIMVVNESIGTYTYDTYTVMTHNTPIGLFFVVLGIIMIMHTIMIVVELYQDIEAEKFLP